MDLFICYKMATFMSPFFWNTFAALMSEYSKFQVIVISYLMYPLSSKTHSTIKIKPMINISTCKATRS